MMDDDGFSSLQKGRDKMNTLITWNQLREMEEAQNRVTRFLGGFPTRRGIGETHSLAVADWSPEVDISQDEHEYLLKADLPEIKKDDLRVTVEDGILCVSGERKSEKEDQKRKFHRVERSYGSFRRSFTLPADTDSKKVTAEFRDGVLKVHLPTTAIAKTKTLQVKVE
jgi:HSP20 family protein